MEKKFILVVTYTCGKSAFLVNTNDLQEALILFRKRQEENFARALSDKSFSLPMIISAELIPAVQ